MYIHTGSGPPPRVQLTRRPRDPASASRDPGVQTEPVILSPTESEDRRHQRPGVMMAHRPYGSTGHTARSGRAKKLVNAGLEPDIISHRRNPREPTPNSHYGQIGVAAPRSVT
ncbi:hypothetical protein PGT21_017880 [Puccinia graminis f. sp. tritici]|uniref:Uncharacterized protein n=1 Tax=Puccinia graminis f. sp. tritici TaxID=56615 RepID=A0A5B0QNP5_PUCGR|nr:hypothetical protein PGT21_017880 [Puccinia graminis f. sp. tritici]